MFSPFERMLAARYLRSRREEGFLSLFTVFSIIGIVLGVATLVVVTAVMDGFKNELLDKILNLRGSISVRADQGLLNDSKSLAVQLETVDGVAHAIPSYFDKALLSKGEQSAVGVVTGIAPSDLERKAVIADNFVAGGISDFTNGHIILGNRLAEKIGLNLGDEVTMISASLNADNGGTGETRLESFIVAGLFDVGFYDFDASSAFITLDDAKSYFEVAEATSIEIANASQADGRKVYQDVWDLLPGGLRVTDWQASNAGFFNMVKTQRNVLFIVLSLIVLVAAINIISGQIMLVNAKTRDIAILRTMGATKKNILKIFFMVGAFIGVLGTILGVAIGWVFAVNIDAIRKQVEAVIGVSLFDERVRGLAKMPAEVQFSTLVWVTVMAIVLTMLASLYPAWKAARQSPVEGIANA